MASYLFIQSVVKKLHEVNFNDIIRYKDYSNEKVYNNGFSSSEEKRKRISGYCCRCDGKHACQSEEDRENKGYRLNNISHGTHTVDFLKAFGLSDSVIRGCLENSWSSDPVLFLMENPSFDYGIYSEIDDDKSEFPKRPAVEWYWIRRSLEDNYRNHRYDDDSFLIQLEYGNMVAALINQFKLGNAYLTNIVKCGMSDFRRENGNPIESGFRNLDSYSKECICNCVKSILLKEINALCEENGKLKPLRIFAFGNRPYWIMNDYLKHCGDELELEYQIYQLPHPASREKNAYRRFILKGALRESLDSDLFLKTGSTYDSYDQRTVEEAFFNAYSGIRLGKKKTSNQYSLNMDIQESLFSKDDIVSEVWIKGAPSSSVSFNWGIGYVFGSKEYWYWNYDTKEYVDKNRIPNTELFENAIKALSETKLPKLRQDDYVRNR